MGLGRGDDAAAAVSARGRVLTGVVVLAGVTGTVSTWEEPALEIFSTEALWEPGMEVAPEDTESVLGRI